MAASPDSSHRSQNISDTTPNVSDELNDSAIEAAPELSDALSILEAMASAGRLLTPNPFSTNVSESARKTPVEAAERRAELERARYRALVESIPVVTFMASLNDDLQELYVSPQIEQLLGFTQEQWLENPFLWYNQLHPEDRERWQDQFGKTCATGTQFRSEYRFLARDGHVVWVHGECQVIRDERGTPLFLQGIAYDITESKNLEQSLNQRVAERTAELAKVNESLRAQIIVREQLENALRERAEQLVEEGKHKDQFLAVLAHELRNPLAPVTMAIDLLKKCDPKSADHAWAQDVIEHQVRQMTRLIDDLLDISRISRGKIRLDKKSVDLSSIVIRATQATRPIYQQRGHSLDLHLPSTPIVIEADELRLEQIIVNLLTNAAKYSEAPGRVDLTTSTEDGQAILRVRDQGVGIPPEMIERIFELFTQVDNSLSRKSQWGLGVGLALVRSLVELHGGTVSAFSEGLGKGSEFSIRLPLQDSSKLASESRAPAAPKVEHRKFNVMVVEDQPQFAESLARLLRAWGHTVQTARDGPSAIAAAPQFHPDVIFMDIGLPGMDGYQTAIILRENPDLKNTLMVALTGYGRDEDKHKADEAGFNLHLIKPVEGKTLRELLEKHQPPT